jgi:hypothetical protein
MLCRWDVGAYDIGLLMATLDYVLMGFDSRFDKGRFARLPRLYVKTLVLKEVCKASLRYAESLSQTHLGVRIPKSTLHFWEVRHGDVVVEVLKILLRLLSYMDYDYSVVDSTKFTDWLKSLHELFIDVRARSSEALLPVHAQLTRSEVEFVKAIPEGGGVMLGDGAFDAKPVLNTITSRGYIPTALNPFCVGGCRVYFYGLYDGWGCCLIFWPYLCLRAMLLGF